MNANPELVLASAWKPSAASTRAEPASHGFGITNGSPSWSARNASRFLVLAHRARERSADLVQPRGLDRDGEDQDEDHDAERHDRVGPVERNGDHEREGGGCEPLPGDPANDAEPHEREAARGRPRSPSPSAHRPASESGSSGCSSVFFAATA